MVTSKSIEKLENSSVRLNITVGKDDSRKEYDELLKKYTKTVQIKGFRKGKVPVSILEKKYGEGIKEEAVGQILDKAFRECLDDLEDKPLSYAAPVVDGEPVLGFDEDFTFSLTYDVYPEITVGKYKELEITVPAVSVGKEEEEEELEKIREQNSMVMDKANKTIEDENIVTIDYAEADEDGKAVEGSQREDFVFTIGTGYNLYKLDDDIKGMKLDEEKVIEKTYPEDEENKDLAGQTKKILVKIKAVKEKQLPELDDELAQDVNEEFNTLDDLKGDIKKKLKDARDNQIKSKKIDLLMEEVMKESTLVIPESMIKAELENRWKNFQMQTRMPEEQILQFLEIQGKTREDMMEEWREEATNALKNQLVISKIVEEEKIEVSDEDVTAEMQKMADENKMTLEDVQNYYNQGGMKEFLKSDIKSQRLFETLLKDTEVKKGKKMSYADLLAGK